MYLELGIDGPQIQTQFPMNPTLDPVKSFDLLLRDYHPLWFLFPEIFESVN